MKLKNNTEIISGGPAEVYQSNTRDEDAQFVEVNAPDGIVLDSRSNMYDMSRDGGGGAP